MTIKFNADELFEIAEKIEKNGVEFYKKAADMFKSNADVNRMFLQLASMEEEHRIVFAAMRGNLHMASPSAEAKLYLQAMANGSVFDFAKNPSVALTGKENVKEILRMAIGLEKDSIIFYLGLKDMVPEDKGRDSVQSIINEEKKHIVLLSNQVRAL